MEAEILKTFENCACKIYHRKTFEDGVPSGPLSPHALGNAPIIGQVLCDECLPLIRELEVTKGRAVAVSLDERRRHHHAAANEAVEEVARRISENRGEPTIEIMGDEEDADEE
jgi:hypothetical protein